MGFAVPSSLSGGRADGKGLESARASGGRGVSAAGRGGRRTAGGDRSGACRVLSVGCSLSLPPVPAGEKRASFDIGGQVFPDTR